MVTSEQRERPAFHQASVEDVSRMLSSPDQGLEAKEAQRRLEERGPNAITQGQKTSPLEMLWRQLKDPLLLVLIGSGALAMSLGKITDGAVVLAVVIINTIIGFVQEFRASQAIESLSQLVPERAEVMRDGQWSEVDARSLVPGDHVRVQAGDKIPADLRLTRVKSLAADEAMLTGESVPADKSNEAVAADAQVGDQTCLAFKGTLATYGSAEGLVIRTGNDTELGRISEMLRSTTELQTPLTRALSKLGKQITVAILVLAVVIMGIGIWRDVSAGTEMMAAIKGTVMFAIALAVGAIPEGLPAIVTIALAIGVRRMAARKAIIRTLPSVETLGSTTVICSDKTGTLTRNEMTVRRIWTPERSYETEGVGYGKEGEIMPLEERPTATETAQEAKPNQNHAETSAGHDAAASSLRTLCQAAVLCSDARLVDDEDKRRVEGDPTEGALIVAAEKAGFSPSELKDTYPRVDVVPFDSERKYMATLHDDPGGTRFVVLKGAPEIVLDHCQFENPQDKERALSHITELAQQGMRVLGLARRDASALGDELNEQQVEAGGFQLLALVGIIDPPRQEAVESIALCHQAGVTVKMITGDHATTASAIGRELNLVRDDDGAVAGAELAAMSDEDLWKTARRKNVFARVSPESKLRLVRALQRDEAAEGRAEVVAMTGDGVNDAPALKQANIGVAMGITGTSASREASDLVLMDDNFATIVAAMEEGRRVYDNLVKSMAFVLPTNLALALILVYAVLFFPFDPEQQQLLLPVKPTQLLWINLVAAVALALPLAFEAKEPNIMQRPPRDPDTPVFSPFLILRTVIAAGVICAVAIAVFSWHHTSWLGQGLDSEQALRQAQTLAVTTVVWAQIFYLLNCRSLKGSMLEIGVFSNPVLFAGIFTVLALQAVFIYAPFMHSVFSSRPLGAVEILTAAAAGAVIMPVIAVEKWLRSKWEARESEGASQQRRKMRESAARA